ncbi:Tat (twin-arginine translocation) pathway signal sequence containing protein [Aestuariibaculum sp. M13]|uniref:Tat (twin-arginine translocation) pathway signal sequence containing protein n=1 Tax=Aestuariibaculum sp. M13 TaxID=2967132 RepID=UPI002159E129|nr:Tat (twin-arginine translocation) pathway signal sequence containing protein [Aestuariibaculum sp. M13]MCR8667920.1 Tat (twin-arginine translocation) pathway signal sequence containing protein [Aestuariibaculum sp. M13]
MKTTNNTRRQFLGALALGATASTISVLTNPIYASTTIFDESKMNETYDWFDQIKGTHRVVYDGSTPHYGLPILWNWAFYLTNNETGSPDTDITAMTVLRHSGLCLALNDEIWKKYKLGEIFNVKDHTKEFAVRNPFYEPQDGDYPINGPGGLKSLDERGAMFCACDLATKVYSGKVAEKIGLDPTKVYQEWVNGMLPNVKLVPSGVWALERAQAHQCAYIFAGE